MTTSISIKSDDTPEELTVTRSPDGDVWVGAGSFDQIRFRTMFGGGMNPNTFVALLNLEKAMKKDAERVEQGRNLTDEWTSALKNLNQ